MFTLAPGADELPVPSCLRPGVHRLRMMPIFVAGSVPL